MDKEVCESETFQILSQQKLINSKEVNILGISIGRRLSFY